MGFSRLISIDIESGIEVIILGEIVDMVGIERFVAVDPGVTTGVVCLDLPFEWRRSDLYDLFRSVRSSKLVTEMELHGSESGQIDSIIGLIYPSEDAENVAKSVIVEDFILRLRTQGRDLLAPVRIAARLDDRLYSLGFGGQITYQSPSDAKSIVTDLRLKDWGL
jgi:hypothetical protein